MMHPQSNAPGRMTNHVRDFQILYDDEIGSLDESGRLPYEASYCGYW